ncbi:MAG TPA: hypothetical protein VGN72_16945 [Tepidisphaeraceae bacterium]|jgi:hypothetical protein|nr:hypothetical protein [Tepidisphaeraceae bacterium]
MFWKDRDYVGEETPQVIARRRGTDCIHSGLLAQSAGAFIMAMVGRPDIAPFWLGLVMILAGVPVLTVGCVRRARSKGYHGRVGALGLLGFVGVLVLAFLPDRNRAKAGFEVVMPMMVSTTWIPPDEDPKWMPRSWGEDQLRGQ